MAWTAIEKDRPVGHVALARATLEDETAQVWHDYTGDGIERLAIPSRLFVDPDHRSRGVGGALMRIVQQYGQLHDFALAFDVMLKDKSAIRLYEAAGCIRIGPITHHHGNGLTEPGLVYAAPAH